MRNVTVVKVLHKIFPSFYDHLQNKITGELPYKSISARISITPGRVKIILGHEMSANETHQNFSVHLNAAKMNTEHCTHMQHIQSAYLTA